MNIENFFMTPQEFADLIVDTLHDSNYFSRDQKAHPIDIEAAFSSVAFAIASGIDAIAKKNLKPNHYTFNLNTHNVNNYSEWKKQNNEEGVKTNAFD